MAGNLDMTHRLGGHPMTDTRAILAHIDAAEAAIPTNNSPDVPRGSQARRDWLHVQKLLRQARARLVTMHGKDGTR
jgi:hypothetical protein